MTAPPLQFPSINPGPVIQDPGTGGAIASALAQVLAAQQAKQEQDWRQAQLQHQWAMEQGNLAVSQGNLAVNQQQLSAQTTETASKTAANAEVGNAIQRSLRPSAASQAAPAVMPTPRPTVMGYPTQGGDGAFPSPVGSQALTAPTGGPQAPPGPFTQILGGGSQAVAPALTSSDIFAGISPENLPAAVKGVQEVRQLSAATNPETSPDQKNFDYLMHLAQTDPAKALLFKQMFIDPKNKPQTVIMPGPAGETKFSQDLGAAQAGFLQSSEKQARDALAGFPSMTQSYGLVDKSFTGALEPNILHLARLLGAVGFKASGDKVADTQVLLRLTREKTLSFLRDQDLSGGGGTGGSMALGRVVTAVSNSDRDFLEQLSGADLTQDPAAIKRIIRINAGTAIMQIQGAISDYRDAALNYKPNAVELNHKADILQQKLSPAWRQYSVMLKAEDAGTSSLGAKLQKIPGLVLPGQP